MKADIPVYLVILLPVGLGEQGIPAHPVRHIIHQARSGQERRADLERLVRLRLEVLLDWVDLQTIARDLLPTLVHFDLTHPLARTTLGHTPRQTFEVARVGGMAWGRFFEERRTGDGLPAGESEGPEGVKAGVTACRGVERSTETRSSGASAEEGTGSERANYVEYSERECREEHLDVCGW